MFWPHHALDDVGNMCMTSVHSGLIELWQKRKGVIFGTKCVNLVQSVKDCWTNWVRKTERWCKIAQFIHGLNWDWVHLKNREGHNSVPPCVVTLLHLWEEAKGAFHYSLLVSHEYGKGSAAQRKDVFSPCTYPDGPKRQLFGGLPLNIFSC